LNLTEKLSSLLKEKEEQEEIKRRAEANIKILNLMIKPVERAIRHQSELEDLANSTDNHLSV
jgi:hypothetical protein